MNPNDQQASHAADFIASILRARIIERSRRPLHASEDFPESLFAEIVRRNRLGATIYAAAEEADAWPVTDGESAEWKREAYRRAVVQSQQLNQAVQLAAVLESREIPCICMRGPFAGSRLYGDVAWRPFADIDLLVPRAHARAAWSVAETAGFELFQENMPLGYFLRHHLHWQLKHPVSGLLCDMHWAVEHPYRLVRIDYAGIFERARMVEADGLTWREPDPVDHFLLMALHVKKHLPDVYPLSRSDDGLLQLFVHGEAMHILDLALLISRDGPSLDGRRLLETAEAWQCMDALAAGLAFVQRMFDMQLPDAVLEEAQSRVPAWQAQPVPSQGSSGAPRWWALAAFKGGFRTEKMADARAYLNPPATYFGPSAGPGRCLRRNGHRVKAATSLAFAGVDTLASVCLAMLRGKRKSADARTNVPMGIC